MNHVGCCEDCIYYIPDEDEYSGYCSCEESVYSCETVYIDNSCEDFEEA